MAIFPWNYFLQGKWATNSHAIFQTNARNVRCLNNCAQSKQAETFVNNRLFNTI